MNYWPNTPLIASRLPACPNEDSLTNRYSTSYRMNRVLRPDRAALIVPIDHGLCGGGRVKLLLEAPVEVMKRFIPVGFMVSTGIAKQSEVELAKASHLARVLAIDAFWPTVRPTRVLGGAGRECRGCGSP